MPDEKGRPLPPEQDRVETPVAPEDSEGMSDAGAGSAQYCICDACNERVLHQKGVPCHQHRCPLCGKPLTVE